MKKLGNMKTLGLLMVSLVLVSCGPKGNLPNIEIIQDMMESPAIKPQEQDPNRPGLGGMRVPPDGTLPMGDYEPYEYGDDFVKSAENKNPLEGQLSPEVLAQGKKQYDIYCAVCHGATGKGDGSVASYMGSVPELASDALINEWKDGQLYHLITRGRGRMGSYASQIPDVNARWAVVNYIRSLQKR